MTPLWPLLVAAALCSSPTAASSPIIQDVALLSPTQHMTVTGNGIPILSTLPTADAPFNRSAPSPIQPTFDTVTDASSSSFYGVAALPDGRTVVLADTNSHTLQLVDVRNGTRRLLYDPALLRQFAPPAAAGAEGEAAAAAGSSKSSKTASESSGASVRLNGIVTTSRDGNGDVLFAGLQGQIWRVPAHREGVQNFGDRVEMLAQGFGRWEVKGVCQSGNRVIVSLNKYSGPPASSSTSSSSSSSSTPIATLHPRSNSNNTTTVTHLPSQSVVIRYNAFSTNATLLADPRIVRRTPVGTPGGGSDGMRIDCDRDHIYIADRSLLAVHAIGNGRVLRNPVDLDGMDGPTAVTVRKGGDVVIVGSCAGVACVREVPKVVWAMQTGTNTSSSSATTTMSSFVASATVHP
ncbi:hypothetical protein HKX48_000976 [Thoreauomyces humboldtii]|nr:hypothetical protein HKX48_000976 [Thoreauomyces humboldtii]